MKNANNTFNFKFADDAKTNECACDFENKEEITRY
jgi:hypothetical protein